MISSMSYVDQWIVHNCNENIYPMKHCLSLLFLCCFLSISFAQSKLILQHQKREKKKKDFPIAQEFSFKINDSTWHYGKVTAFDTLNITISRSDGITHQVPMQDIKLITRDRVANQRWMEPFAYFLVGAGMVLAATPVIWAVDGGAKALEGLEFAGILTLVSLPPLWYGSRQERYNLEKKWRIAVIE